MIRQINQQSQPKSPQTDGDLNYSRVEEPDCSSLPSLTDADHEFLFNQLLEGIAHGWHPVKVAKFFQRLEERGEQQLWIAWLERYQAKISASSDLYQQQLGARMIRLGEITQSISSVNQIGSTAYTIGKQILYGKNPNLVWEYNGSDLPMVKSSELSDLASNDDKPLPSEVLDGEASDASVTKEIPSFVPQPLSESTVAREVEELDTDSELVKTEVSESKSDLPAESLAIDQEISEEIPLNTIQGKENEESLVTTQPNLAQNKQTEPLVLAEDNVVNLSWQQFTELIEEDDHLLEQIAKQFDLTDKDPKSIIKAVTSQLNNDASESIDESTLKLIESWFNLGLKQVSAGDLNEAIISWEKALELNPNLAEAWHNRGSALGRLGNYEQALESFEQALKIDANNTQAWNERAHTLYQLRQWQEAVGSWERAIAIVPSNYQFWYNRGCALEELQQYQKAIASYEKALEIKPDFQLARSRYTSLLGNKHPIN